MSSVMKNDKPARLTPQNRILINYPVLKMRPASKKIWVGSTLRKMLNNEDNVNKESFLKHIHRKQNMIKTCRLILTRYFYTTVYIVLKG